MMPCSRTLDARCWGHNIPCNKEGGREREPWWEINKIRCDLIWSRHLVTGWWSWRVPRVHVCRIIFLYRYTLHYIFIHVRKMCARVMEWVIWPHEEPSGIFERTSVFAIRGSFTFSCQTLESKFTPPIHVILTKQIHHPGLSSWFSSLHYSITALDSQDGRIIDSSESQSDQFVSIW